MSVDLFRWIVDHQATALVLLNGQLDIEYMNSSAESLFARSGNQLHGQSWQHLFTPDNGLKELLERVLVERVPTTQRSEKLTLSADGSRITVDITITPLADDGPLYILVEFLSMDRILKISREEASLAKQEAARVLVRGLAHEVKNPLGGIRGAAQLLAIELGDQRYDEYTSIIIEEADRLRNLVDRILGSNRIPKWASTNIHEVLERVLRLMQVEAGESIRFERDYDPSLPEIDADREQLIQAVLNIVRNGMEALQGQGDDNPQKTMHLSTRAIRQFTIGKQRHRLVLQLRIEDNGPGIDRELMENMFYPMVSGRAQGSGLGLSIAQQVVAQHAGVIDCESEPGRTRFTLYLPIGAQA
ncbi:MAG: PAS domain-containing protein [Natronospirillum sp.]|uniref:nitrogen regulation protein NR(II) n=1 Tax=Natronospirillum sp. TaxID=2812955 RepID=UPI0025E9229B|nr:nitrogen regulation protein NR(II) [Natronospirillum sp.]MCH8552718.1 PAS domain-containing protein [Natronospirillum sp.]